MPIAEMSGSVAVGFFGKLPARGDFLRAGLPRSFVDPWDAWLQRVIAGSKAALGEAWLDAWMEAPLWRFVLPAGACGPDPVIGVWMPSVDRAGRHFPLSLAQVLPGIDAAGVVGRAPVFLGLAEEAGLAALQDDLSPEVLTQRLTTPFFGEAVEVPEMGAFVDGYAMWWTEGSPLVPACTLVTVGLPDSVGFIGMIDARNDSNGPSAIAASGGGR